MPESTTTIHLKGVKAHMDWIWGYWAGHKSILFILALLTLISTAVAVAYPLVFRWVIDELRDVFTTGDGAEKIGGVMLVLLGIALGRFLSGFYPATRALMNLRLDRDIREDVFGKLMEKDYAFNNSFRTGDLVTRLSDDIYEYPKISWFGCSGIFRAVESGSKLLFCLIVMLTINWQLALLSIIPLPFMMWAFYKLRTRIRKSVEGSQRTISQTNDLLEAVFSGIQIVKAFRAEAGQKKRLAAIMKERRAIFLDLMRVRSILMQLDTLASRLGQMIVIAAGGLMVINGEITIGTLFAFYIFLDMLAHPMMDLPHLFMTGQQAFVSIDRVEELRAFPVTVERHGGSAMQDISEVSCEGLAFSYDGTRDTVRNISFSVPRGSRVAIVGPVASGKSTLLKLIAGILEPTRGKISINGIALDGWDWHTYKRLIGYVPQEGVLFSKSVEENVLFGRSLPEDETLRPLASQDNYSEADHSWARHCLSTAQMDGDLADWDKGVSTVVGQKGSLVSGGQKQRIAIARALAGKPRLLLLDDCTAALDARNEDRFWTQLRDDLGECTTFIVSHRLATIRQADRILVLEDGEMIDEGTHDDLALRCETYREFLSTERKKAHLDQEAASEE
jgi:ATP-binding cassette, subfamily B, multidrug efflux pump